MKLRTLFFTSLLLSQFISLAQDNSIPKYVPADLALQRQIEQMDQAFFDAYNQCDMKKQEAIYADDIEFFHDKGGLMTSKKELLEATRKNICGKVTRILIPGSIEVYPIHNYGAVEIGFHRFYNNQEPNAESKPSKFIIVWKKENELWRIAKVVSLH
jgi:ketosteroid isomerase-like protein